MEMAFLDRLNAAADLLVTTGWLHFWQLLVLAALLAAIDLGFARRIGPQWRCALWLIFFVKLALPPQLALPSSPAYWWTPSPAVSTAATVPASQTGPASIATPEQWSQTGEIAPGIPASPSSSESAGSVQPSWRLILTAAWLSGVVVIGALTLARHRRAAAVLARSVDAPQALRDALQRARERIGLRAQVDICISDAGIGPLVVGLRRPTIHLPRSLAGRLTPAQLDAVLTHELLHVRRGDLWIAAVQTVARVVFFYHPAVWWVNSRLARLREEATDREVLAHPDVDARTYSRALVAAAEDRVFAGSGFRFALGVIETKSQLEHRIRMNLHLPRTGRARLSCTGLLSIALLGLVVLPMAPAGSSAASRAAPARFAVVDAADLARRIDSTCDSIFAAFNRRDRASYLEGFTTDPVMLPPGNPLISGRAGVSEAYFNTPAGLRYETILWKDREFHRIGPVVVETGLAGLQARMAPGGPIITDPRQVLTIWQEDADGTFRVKVLSWNPLPQAPNFRDQSEPQAFAFGPEGASFSNSGEFSDVLHVEDRFHGAFETQRRDEAVKYYAEQAVLFSPETGPLRGQDAIRRHITSIPAERIPHTIERQVARVEGNADHVLVVNLFRWSFTPPGSDRPVSVAGKGIHLWQRDADGEWRILFDLWNPSQPTAG